MRKACESWGLDRGDSYSQTGGLQRAGEIFGLASERQSKGHASNLSLHPAAR